jgi:uncharacterized iron-regulated membrane protein
MMRLSREHGAETALGSRRLSGALSLAGGSNPTEAARGSARRIDRLKARRKLWLRVHLYLGLSAGAVLALAGLTGSILVFWQEIEAWLNPALHGVEVHPGGESAFRPLSEITAAAEGALPTGARFAFGYYPRHDGAAFQLFYAVPAAAEPDQYQAFVDPYTAGVIGTRLVQAAEDWCPRVFMPFVFQLHYALLLKGNGTILVGIAGAVTIVSVLTGLILWWPLTGKWLQAFTLKRGASFTRCVFDLHKTFGFYTAVVLLAVLFSGVYMNLPDRVLTLVRLFSPTVDRYAVQSAPPEGRPPIGLATAVRIADQRYPGGRIDWLYGAPMPTDAYTVCKRGLHELSRFVDRRCVVVDQYDGAILHVEDVASGSGGEAFLAWQWPLHSGRAFGMAGRIGVLLAGLACPVLYITGVIRWLQKRRAKRKHLEKTINTEIGT